jgi:hypothetical protein
MIDVNSNCSRVDAVKSVANQLKMQLAQAPKSAAESDSYRKAQSQLQALDQDVKSNNAQKAETALSTATSAVQTLRTQDSSSSQTQNGLDVYA